MKGFAGGSVVKNLPANAGNASLISGPDFPGDAEGKESTCSAGDLGSISGWGRSPGGGHGNPLQYFLLGESPRTEEPGGLQCMGSPQVRRD